MSSPAPLSAVSCCAGDTKCAWQSRPTWLASSSRLGLRRSLTGRMRGPWQDLHRDFLTHMFRKLLEDPGSDQVAARRLGAVYPVLGGDSARR